MSDVRHHYRSDTTHRVIFYTFLKTVAVRALSMYEDLQNDRCHSLPCLFDGQSTTVNTLQSLAVLGF